MYHYRRGRGLNSVQASSGPFGWFFDRKAHCCCKVLKLNDGCDFLGGNRSGAGFSPLSFHLILGDGTAILRGHPNHAKFLPFLGPRCR